LNQLGYSKLYNINECPFQFIDTVCLDNDRPEQLNTDGGLKSVEVLNDFKKIKKKIYIYIII